jgi:hypothetical protein
MGDPVLHHRDPADEPPPFLRTWTRVYLVVLSYLFALITVLYILSRLWAA